MSFMHIEFIIPALLAIFLLILFITKKEFKFFSWIEDYWFYKRSNVNKVSSVLFCIGMALLILALLDLRGPEENIEAKVPKEETMILIDSSASMLSEDVRPNRFRKAILLAKHYIKKAVGQYISITVFSDAKKIIIPFTNDTDLLEARLSGLESLDLSDGGTGLKLAIQETVQHFKARSGSINGNILILTDAENNGDFGVVNIQEDINIAIVGVGTLKGGPIPIRDKRGNFKGNKKYQGKEVITKLDEETLRALGKKIKNYKYWTASSYSLPTNKILDFFNSKNSEQSKQDNIRIRPVLANYLMVPAVLILIISFLLKSFKTFIVPMFLFISLSAYTQEKSKNEPPKKTEEIIRLENKFKTGSISAKEKRKLANELLKNKNSAQAAKLYEEIVDEKITDNNKEDYFNWGASELMNKNPAKGLSIYKNLYDHLKKNDKNSKLMEETKKNMLKALIQQEQQKKQQQKNKKDQKQDKKKDQKQDQKKDDQKQDGKNQNKKEDQKKGDQSKDKKDNDSKQDENKQDKKEEKNKQDKKDEDPKQDEDGKEDKQKQQAKNDPKESKDKLPALLKQLMNDDNQLQRKVIDAATNKRGQGDKKDW